MSLRFILTGTMAALTVLALGAAVALIGVTSLFHRATLEVDRAIESIRPVMTRCGLRFPDRSELPLELPSQVDLTVPAPTPGSMTAIPG